MSAFERLLPKMQELRDLSGVVGLATWDQETYMPSKTATARAEQVGTLQSIIHERLVEKELGDLLDQAAADPKLTADQKQMVAVLKRERDREVKIPAPLVRAIAEQQGKTLDAWRQARKDKSFRVYEAPLKQMLQLRREQADAWGHDGERYDAMLENYEPGMRVARLNPVLGSLKNELVKLLDALRGKSPKHSVDLFANKRFDVEAQRTFILEVLSAMGFDLEAGRLDRSIHPFSGGTHPLDVRLTTRFGEDKPMYAILVTMHEGGHGLYEQGFAESLWRTPLASAPSMGIHESQSRLWENIVGRSRAFWTHYLPKLQQAFPEQLRGVTLDQFYAAVNRVQPTLSRGDADELTYNLHIYLRYELELALVRDQLPVSELPGAWNERMRSLLGLDPHDDLVGVLQDIHWAGGDFGYFPTYSLGNLYSASIYEAAKRAVPGLEERISKGDLKALSTFLRDQVHSHGFRSFAEDRVKAVTGAGLTDKDFIRYVKTKFSELYDVSL